MLQEKKCSTCKEVKPAKAFDKDSSEKYKLKGRCKGCRRKERIAYRRTKKGLISDIYCSQKATSKKREHSPPTYTLEELREFALGSLEFNKLYEDWAASDYDRWMVPSFDRDDDYKGYSFENFNKWMPWKNNRIKGLNDRKKGINNKASKAVMGTHLVTGEATLFYSISEAGRQTGIDFRNISACCLGKARSAGGYVWKYKNMH